MCGMEAATLAITAVSAAASAIESANQADMQSQIANQNAENYKRQAIDAERRGAEEGYRAQRQGRELIARQLAAMADNNVDSSSGTMLNMIADTAGQSVYDAAVIRNNAEREAYGHYFNQSDALSRASMYEAAGANKAFGSLLSGAAQLTGLYNKYYGKTPSNNSLKNTSLQRWNSDFEASRGLKGV